MLIKINLDEYDIKEMIKSHFRERGWNILDFEYIEAHGVLGAKNSIQKLRIHARCEATEIDDSETQVE